MTSASATLILLNDAIPEGNETFIVQITSTRLGAEIGRQNTLILVVRANDEPYGQFQFDQVRRSMGVGRLLVLCPSFVNFVFLSLDAPTFPQSFLPSFILSLPPSLTPSIPSFCPLSVRLSLPSSLNPLSFFSSPLSFPVFTSYHCF